jgi:NAD-dependent deacetylase
LEQSLVAALERATDTLLAARHAVALVGAGLSVESGIPPFRGEGGLWTRFGAPSMNGYQRFLQDPVAYWREQLAPREGFRAELFRAIRAARPNAGHHALVSLERLGVLRMTITQNVDGLHVQAGSQRLVEIHGNRDKLRCIGCGLRLPRAEWPLEQLIQEGRPPRCPECGELLKGDGVMFGEPIPRPWADESLRHVAQCDCMLLVGTSGTVYPAAAFPPQVKSHGGLLLEVNPSPTPFSLLCDLVLRAPAALALPLLVEAVERRGGPRSASTP